MTLKTLTPHSHLDLSALPLGAALRPQPLLGATIDGSPLGTLASTTETAGGGQLLQASHPAGFTLAVDVEPDPDHAAVVWHLMMGQAEGSFGPRLHDLRPLELVLDGALAPDPIIRTWLGGAMQADFPPDAVTPQSHVVYPHTPAYYHAAQYVIGTRGGRSSDHDMPYALVTAQHPDWLLRVPEHWGHCSGTVAHDDPLVLDRFQECVGVAADLLRCLRRCDLAAPQLILHRRPVAG